MRDFAEPLPQGSLKPLWRSVGRDFQRVPKKNKALLSDAIDRIDRIDGTPVFDSSCDDKSLKS